MIDRKALIFKYGFKGVKKIIKQKIERSNNIEHLEFVLKFLSENDKPFTIPEHMKAGIEQGLDDIKNGHFITMEEFEEKYREYLKD